MLPSVTYQSRNRVAGSHSTFKGSRVASTSSRAARAVRASAVRPVASGAAGKVKKVVLAYSGGLDTSVILKWLQDTYDCEVVTFTADLGQVRPYLQAACLLLNGAQCHGSLDGWNSTRKKEVLLCVKSLTDQYRACGSPSTKGSLQEAT